MGSGAIWVTYKIQSGVQGQVCRIKEKKSVSPGFSTLTIGQVKPKAESLRSLKRQITVNTSARLTSSHPHAQDAQHQKEPSCKLLALGANAVSSTLIALVPADVPFQEQDAG